MTTGHRRRWTSLSATGLCLATALAGFVLSPAPAARADGSNCDAQLPPDAGSATYHKYVTDPDTAATFDVPVDNPQDCTADLGAPDPFRATYTGGRWVFNTPPVENGFAAVPATVSSCPMVIEYAVRGTLEDLDESNTAVGGHPAGSKFWSLTGLAHDGGGGVVGESVYQALQEVYGSSVGRYADYYPADDILSGANVLTLTSLAVASIQAGVTRAVNDLNTLATACPASRLVLLGYSQGAMVLRRALASSSLSTAVSSPRVIVELFGDAEFTPAEANQPGSAGYTSAKAATTLLGTYSGGHTGLAYAFEPSLIPTAPALPARFRVLSWCHDQELVCQGNGSLDPHLTYGQQDGYAAARSAAAYFATTAPSGASTTPAPVAVPSAALLGTACVSRTIGTTQVTVLRDNTASPAGQPVTVRQNVGYVDNGAITSTSSSTSTVPAGTSGTWVSTLPFVATHNTFRYQVEVPAEANPRGWTSPARTQNSAQQLYEGMITGLC
jgi:hypothetical protein